MSGRLLGRALVTGGSRGIGRAIAPWLAREGAAVAVGHVSQPAAAGGDGRGDHGGGGTAVAFGFDVGDAAAAGTGSPRLPSASAASTSW
jgi:3-oxoacyl-[acyl-carrier protein] reductase